MDAVAPGLGADVDHRVAGAGGAGVEDLVLGHEADAHRVDQDVAVVGAVEAGLAADRRHPDAVAVARDPGDHAVDQMARLRVLGRAEAERVEQRHRPRAHGEDVAQDAADPGRSTLVGLDVARVVVALDLEHRGQAVTEVDHARVLARAADHLRPLGRQQLQPALRRLVGAVLAPHHREDAELDQRSARARGSRRSRAYSACERPCSATSSGVIAAIAPASPAPRPGSAAGSRRRCRRSCGSAARSGWGIRPSTLRPGPSTPAIAPTEPFGLAR